MSSRSLTEVLWAWYHATGTWPPSKEVAMRSVKKGGDLRLLENHLKTHRMRGVSGGVPKWAISYLAGEVGSFSAYLTIPELAPKIVRAAAEAWTPDKLQAAIEQTSYYKKTTSKQRQYELLTPAEKKQTKQQFSVWVMETLNAIWGPELAKQRGYTLNSEKVQTWAAELSSGRQSEEMFTFKHERAAEGIKGTPAHTALTEEYRRAGAAEVEQENLRGQLEEEWRSWIGEHVTPPNLKAWAENIYMNRRSQDDFEQYVRATANNLYGEGGKPEFMSYADWVAPAKQIITDHLEVANVKDDDPLLQAYIKGEASSLTEILNRVRRDSRHENTERARGEAVKLGLGIRERWGLS